MTAAVLNASFRRLGSPVVILLLLADSSAAQTPAPTDPQSHLPQYDDQVEVVGVTPIHGLGVSPNLIPSNVQSVTSAAIDATRGGSLADALSSGLVSVHVNEAQSNPFQVDLQFRGFAASPLLGLPQGLAVYQDGVRINEPFGDTVNWDVLPDSAIATMNLLPGSNPLFGLNAIGGALSVQTKNGFTHPGHAAGVSVGSFGRVWADLESGGHTDRLSYFATTRLLAEDGWRDFSESRVRQFFGAVGWRDGRTSLNLSLTAGANRLIGNGAAPVDLLGDDRSAIFTHPDQTKTALGMVAFTGRRVSSQRVVYDGLFYYRPATIDTINGDDTGYEPCDDEEFEGLLCEEGEDEPIEDQLGDLVTAGDPPYDGTLNTSRTRSRGWGGALQATVLTPLARRENTLIAGVSFDGGRSRYEAATELGRLTETRGAVGVGIRDAEADVRLRTTVRHFGLYAVDFLPISRQATLMASARLSHSAIRLRDELGEDLNGDHSFTRLNPAIGLTWTLSPDALLFGSFSMSSRVPTPSELSCADPEDPCRLPNAFVADPPLEQVVARTYEGGLRGAIADRGISWNAAVFSTRNRDDIIFVSSGALTSEGHFENIGDTARKGLELGASVRIAQWGALSGSYTVLRATFESPLVLSSPNHPEAVDDEIAVEAGDTIPGVPRHHLRSALSANVGMLSLGASVIAGSSHYYRGDEANLLDPVSGFAVVNVTGRYSIGPRLAIIGRVSNLFDRRYATFGLLGEADEVLGDDFEDPQFQSPGAPRAAWIGVKVTIP
jgi:outer membrane receptor protein involved in Fe transport